VSGSVQLYARAAQLFWRGDSDEWQALKQQARQAANRRQALKKQVEVKVLGEELPLASQEDAWQRGKKAAVLHKALDKMLHDQGEEEGTGAAGETKDALSGSADEGAGVEAAAAAEGGEALEPGKAPARSKKKTRKQQQAQAARASDPDPVAPDA